jgi:hypothetical protein
MIKKLRNQPCAPKSGASSQMGAKRKKKYLHSRGSERDTCTLLIILLWKEKKIPEDLPFMLSFE